MFTLEVLIKTGSAWPHDKDRVTYGLFNTRTDAEIFFNRGVHQVIVNAPRFDPDHKVITDLSRILNDPSEGITWTYTA